MGDWRAPSCYFQSSDTSFPFRSLYLRDESFHENDEQEAGEWISLVNASRRGYATFWFSV